MRFGVVWRTLLGPMQNAMIANIRCYDNANEFTKFDEKLPFLVSDECAQYGYGKQLMAILGFIGSCSMPCGLAECGKVYLVVRIRTPNAFVLVMVALTMHCIK